MTGAGLNGLPSFEGSAYKNRPAYVRLVLTENLRVFDGAHLLHFRVMEDERESVQSGGATGRASSGNGKDIEARGSCAREATRPEPGQFFHFICGKTLERMLPRPISVHGACGFDKGFCAPDSGGGKELEFLVEIVGSGTAYLCSLEEGETVEALGPLGRGFTVDALKESPEPAGRTERKYTGAPAVLLVSGGMGICPLYYLAKELERMNLPYVMLAGFKSSEKHYRGVHCLSGDVRVFTEDGSVGEKGMVSDGIRSLDMTGFGAVYTCGPEDMMRAVAASAEEARVPCYVSLTSRMGCGLGACGCCVVSGSGKNLRVCSDGPVFRADEWVSLDSSASR